MATSRTAAEANADAKTDELQSQLASLRSDLSELTTAMTRFTKAQAETFRAQAADGLRYVQDAGQEQLNAASDYAGRKYAETEDYIRTNPTTAVGIAAGVGFLIGLIVSRR